MVEKHQGSRPLELIAIVGPTACGKTRRSVELARHLQTEIISGDSRQVYCGMDLGTGKDIEEYGEVKVHLLDLLDAGEKYNLHRFLQDFRRASSEISRKGNVPILCGGSGMYVEAALSGLVLPEVPANSALREKLAGKSLEELTAILADMKRLHNTTDVDTTQRAIRAIEIEQYYVDNPELARGADKTRACKPNSLIIGLDIDRESRRKRITTRLHQRLEQGMVAEVERLLEKGVAPDDLIYYGLEYKFLTLYLIGKLKYDEMVSQLEIAIHQFAKRQMTWFRGMEKRGYIINWLPYDLSAEEFLLAADKLIKNFH